MTEDHAIVSRDQWVAARQQLLEREKELTRLRDQLSEQRRSLPWVRNGITARVARFFTSATRAGST